MASAPKPARARSRRAESGKLAESSAAREAAAELAVIAAGTSSSGAGVIDLPPTFKPTHETAGLDGFPAIDLFGPAHAPVRAWFWGRVTRLSGRPISRGGVPGGAYGLSVYITNMANGQVRYVTHLESVRVRPGQQVKPGTVIGHVADSSVSGKPGTTHAHLGHHKP